MSISEWFSDDELISELRMFFTESERETIDFQALLGQINWIDGETGEIKVRKRVFRFDYELCSVMEVEV
jgi:hypothetical protein